MRTVLALASSVAVVTAVAVGTQVIGADKPDRQEQATGSGRHYTWSNSPAPLLLALPHRDRDIDTLGSWTGPTDEDGMHSTGIADGGWVPAAELLDVGELEELDFWFGMPGWTWRAELIPIDDDPEDMHWCWRKAVVRASGEQTFTVEPAGPAATYRVNLFGHGPQGNRSAELRWTTTRGGAGAKKCA